jgi:hypothetical protein
VGFVLDFERWFFGFSIGTMRNQKQNARLQQARGQLFICGIFGNCASSVLSPRTPPGIPEQLPIEELLLRHSDVSGVRGHCEIPLSGPVPGSPSTSASDAGNDCCNASSSGSATTDARSSVASDFATDLEDFLAEIKAGNVTKMTIGSLNNKLQNCQGSRELVRSSGVASSLIAVLLASDLAGTDGARDSVDERQVPHVLEEALAALASLAEFDDAAVREMATPEFLAVVMWYVRNGRRDARESACSLLEKLSLEESFKATMGASDTGVMDALNAMLRDENHLKLVKLATRTLLALCLLRDNRIRYVSSHKSIPLLTSPSCQLILGLASILH